MTEHEDTDGVPRRTQTHDAECEMRSDNWQSVGAGIFGSHRGKKMSYFPCQKCGKYVGVIGTTIYSCGCKPDIPTSGATAPTANGSDG